MLQGLLGRREFLKELCGYEEEQEDFLTESGGGDGKPESDGSSPESAEAANIKRIGNILRSVLNKERETSYEEAPSPRGEIICDHGNLDDQRIEVIDDREDGVIRLRLKIRRGKSPLMSPVEMARYDHDAPYSVFMPQTMDGLKINRDDEITYRGEGAYGPESLKLCSAFSFERNGVTVRIADPSRPGDTIYSCSYNNSGLVRTSIGLVEISAPRDMDPDSIAGIVSDIFAKDFGLPDALDEVSPDSAAPYKRARLAWSRRAEAGSLSQEAEEAAEGMQLEEVFPGYSTYVQKGRHKELLAISGEGARAYHRLSMRLDDEGNPKDVGRKVARTLARGILCSTERFSRRLCFKGMSTEADMDSGGADSVFTRLGYEGDLKREYDKSGVVIVFKPEVFDRTDFYAQGGDTYGTTDADYFDGRLTPEDMFQKLKDQMLCGTNELMFRTGLAGSSIEYVLVEDESVRTAILDYMHDMGITEMYGKPVEELIRIRHEDHPVPVMVDHGATGAPIPPDPFGGGGFWPDQPEQTGESGSDMLELDDWVWPSEPEPEPEPIDYAKETLEKMREIARGTATYDNVGEILDFMYYNPREFDELIDDIFAKVGPDKIKSDFEDYILNMDTNDLKGIVDTLANKTSFEYNDDEMAVKFLIEKVGINFEELYAKKINGEQE